MISKEESLKLLQKLITQKSSGKDKRHTELLKKPERAPIDKDEWFIYVPPCFNDCLDIAKTERRVKTGRKVEDEKTGKMKDEKKTRKVWTQGSRFAFHRGCTLYDTPKAYRRWGDAIKEIKYCISIHDGKSVKLAKKKEEKRKPGSVEFSILSPSIQTGSLEEIGAYKLTQYEFINFLIDGNPEIISE